MELNKCHHAFRNFVSKVQEKQFKRSKADPCLYFCWRDGRLSIIISWVDDLILLGMKDDVKR